MSIEEMDMSKAQSRIKDLENQLASLKTQSEGQHARLRESWVKRFVHDTPIAMAMFDTNICYLMVSDKWIEDFQLQGQVLTGICQYDLFPNTPPRWKKVHQRCLKGAVESCQEDYFRQVNGQIEYLNWITAPWYDDLDNVGGLILVTEIITRQMEDKQNTRAALSHYRFISEQQWIQQQIVSYQMLKESKKVSLETHNSTLDTKNDWQHIFLDMQYPFPEVKSYKSGASTPKVWLAPIEGITSRLLEDIEIKYMSDSWPEELQFFTGRRYLLHQIISSVIDFFMLENTQIDFSIRVTLRCWVFILSGEGTPMQWVSPDMAFCEKVLVQTGGKLKQTPLGEGKWQWELFLPVNESEHEQIKQSYFHSR